MVTLASVVRRTTRSCPTRESALPIELPDRRGVLSACVVGERMGPVPIDLSLTQKKDRVRVVFKDRVRDSYDLFLFWNHRLLKGAPFKLEPPTLVF